MQYKNLKNILYWDALEQFFFEPHSKQQFRQISKFTDELHLQDQINEQTYNKLIEILSLIYMESIINKKLETKVNVWNKKFNNLMDHYLEKIF